MNILWCFDLGISECWSNAAKELGHNLIQVSPNYILAAIHRDKIDRIYTSEDNQYNTIFGKARMLETEVYTPSGIFGKKVTYKPCSDLEKAKPSSKYACEFAIYQNIVGLNKLISPQDLFNHFRIYINEYNTALPCCLGYLSDDEEPVAFASASKSLVYKDAWLAADIVKAGGNVVWLEERPKTGILELEEAPIFQSIKQFRMQPIIKRENCTIPTYKEALKEILDAE